MKTKEEKKDYKNQEETTQDAKYIYFYRVPGTGDSVWISQFLFACLLVCPSPPKKLRDSIIN